LLAELTWFQNIVLSQKPAISTTMTSLPTTLLEQLLGELSTLASVYHKPPESFVGKGRYGADEIQRAAILEQRQDAEENPIAASVAAAANGTAPPQNNMENLLDIDFDGAAPASTEHGLGTPDRMASPAGGASSSGGMADMMGLFDAPAPQSSSGMGMGMGMGMGGMSSGGDMNDLMNGFASLDFGSTGSSQPLPAAMQLQQAQTGGASEQKKNDLDDLLGF
jgi:AP-1 complex subunit beta-1